MRGVSEISVSLARPDVLPALCLALIIGLKISLPCPWQGHHDHIRMYKREISMQEYLLRENALGINSPLFKRICRSIKQDGTYTCRVSRVHHWNRDTNPRGCSCVPSVTHFFPVRVMLDSRDLIDPIRPSLCDRLLGDQCIYVPYTQYRPMMALHIVC
jgi:hypothetical protein